MMVVRVSGTVKEVHDLDETTKNELDPDRPSVIEKGMVSKNSRFTSSPRQICAQ